MPSAAWLAAIILAAAPAASAAEDREAAERRRMTANIEQLAAAGALSEPLRLDPRVLAAMREIPRHLFVPEAVREEAYRDTALPIGHQATISQPFIVAVMTHLADVDPGETVLEVGTGSGYQAAILSRLGARAFTIEIVPQLAAQARQRLQALGYARVEVRAGDGYAGWPEHAPFDAIIVTAGATHVPQPLVDQLKPGGRLVIPVGPDRERQQLTLITKTESGRLRRREFGPVVFVPLQERSRKPR